MRFAERTARFSESVIREMTRLLEEYPGAGINLAQGFPDFDPPRVLRDAACAAIQGGVNQYSVTWGVPSLRRAIAEKVVRFGGPQFDPDREVTVTCGSTEAMAAAVMALVDPGDEVIIFAPYYENYWPDTVLAGAVPRFVLLHLPDWSFDPDELRAAFSRRTRAIIVNTPNNPTGKVFSAGELALIAALCQEYDVVAITDEIYEHLVYEGRHISLATLPGMRERTVTISGISKTFSVTGWRVGYVLAPAPLSDAIRKVHDFLTVAAPSPLQAAAEVALRLDNSYYASLLEGYRQRRAYFIPALQELGFRCRPPTGAYYVLAGIEVFGQLDDVTFARALVRRCGVAVVPGSSFYPDPAMGRTLVRFSFPKKLETLREAVARLRVALPVLSS
jgi:aspartate/methionine/tyrosine aminotransferase